MKQFEITLNAPIIRITKAGAEGQTCEAKDFGGIWEVWPTWEELSYCRRNRYNPQRNQIYSNVISTLCQRPEKPKLGGREFFIVFYAIWDSDDRVSLEQM